MSLIRKHGAVLQAWACLDLVLKSGQNHSVKKLKSHFLTVHVCIWSKCQM